MENLNQVFQFSKRALHEYFKPIWIWICTGFFIVCSSLPHTHTLTTLFHIYGALSHRVCDSYNFCRKLNQFKLCVCSASYTSLSFTIKCWEFRLLPVDKMLCLHRCSIPQQINHISAVWLFPHTRTHSLTQFSRNTSRKYICRFYFLSSFCASRFINIEIVYQILLNDASFSVCMCRDACTRTNSPIFAHRLPLHLPFQCFFFCSFLGFCFQSSLIKGR